MKFIVRDGYVVRTVTIIDLGDGNKQTQENSFFGGQLVDLTTEQAEDHAHKLEPKDKAAEAFLASKVLPPSTQAATGLSPEALALVAEMAKQMAVQIVAAMQAPAAAPAAA